MAAEYGGNACREIALFELLRRHVHGDRGCRQTGRAPERDLPAGFINDPIADIPNQAGFLGDGDKLAGRNHASVRMPPADQRLRADQVSAYAINLGLVMEGQFIPGQGAAQVLLKLQTVRRH